jgi:hypothetical protein
MVTTEMDEKNYCLFMSLDEERNAQSVDNIGQERRALGSPRVTLPEENPSRIGSRE